MRLPETSIEPHTSLLPGRLLYNTGEPLQLGSLPYLGRCERNPD